MNIALCGLEDALNMEHSIVDIPLEGCRDVFMHEESPSLTCENVLPSPLEHSHVFTFCSTPLFSFEYILMMFPLIILRFVILMLIWRMRITCFICLVGMLKHLSP